MGQRYLIDSNTLIEFTGELLPDEIYAKVSGIIDSEFNISFINKIEVLAHPSAGTDWENFIEQANVLNIDDEIIFKTIEIRKIAKLKIPDAIVAATAIINNLVLLSRNISDFKKVKLLKVENPWDWE